MLEAGHWGSGQFGIVHGRRTTTVLMYQWALGLITQAYHMFTLMGVMCFLHVCARDQGSFINSGHTWNIAIPIQIYIYVRRFPIYLNIIVDIV